MALLLLNKLRLKSRDWQLRAACRPLEGPEALWLVPDPLDVPADPLRNEVSLQVDHSRLHTVLIVKHPYQILVSLSNHLQQSQHLFEHISESFGEIRTSL